MRRSVRRLVSASLFAATSLLAVPYAAACGGLFCGAPPPVPTPPAPVDQTAERIVFEVLPNDEIAAHVHISYAGSADNFAWIVPVPEPPVIEESTDAFIDGLFDATNLNVVLPAREPCPTPSGGGGGGIGCSADDAASAGAVNDSGTRGESTVDVVDQIYTENYEATTLTAEVAADLVEWLQDNDYNVSDNMIPVMETYTDQDMAFVAVRLREGRSASDIVPIKMTYTDVHPMIPIELTAVAARPLMGIAVVIVAPQPFLPENYSWMRPDPSEIFFDDVGNTTYFEWVARQAAEAEGRLWVAEFIGRDPRGRGQFVSRFYTRLNPEQMTLDPIFSAGPMDEMVTNTLDLSDRPTPFLCGGGVDVSLLPNACAFNYCGLGAACGVLDGRVACACPEGQIAQPITGPDGTAHVTCVPEVNPFGITDAASGVGGQFDPCADFECGAGECVVKAGFPGCDCDEGAVACLEPDGRTLCVPTNGELETFGPGAGPESGPVVASIQRAVDRSRGVPAGGSALLAAVVLLGLRSRRRPAA